MASTDETTNIQDKAIDELKDSLIYQMSLGSRELFHSNVWAWLMEFDPRFINVFFKDFDKNICTIDDGKIYREKGNFDISFCCVLNGSSKKKEIFILENKIKSFISIEQLSKYTEKISKNFSKENIHAIYTGIKDSLSDKQRQSIKDADWKFLSYADIGKGIKEVIIELQKELNTNMEKDTKKLGQCRLIDAYADSITSMANVLSETLNSSGQNFIYDVEPPEKAKRLEDVRLLDVYKKMKVADFSKYFRDNHYEKIVIPDGYKLDSWCGFSNKQPIFDIRFKKVVPSDDHMDEKGKPTERSLFEIGIQIQGDQYRFACLTMKWMNKEVNKQKDDFFDKIVTYSDPKWFDGEIKDTCSIENHAHKVKLHKPNKKNLKYCSYEDKASDGYIFIYQYAYIKDIFGRTPTYEQVAIRIANDLKDARDSIKQLQNAGLEKPSWVLTNDNYK